MQINEYETRQSVFVVWHPVCLYQRNLRTDVNHSLKTSSFPGSFHQLKWFFRLLKCNFSHKKKGRERDVSYHIYILMVSHLMRWDLRIITSVHGGEHSDCGSWLFTTSLVIIMVIHRCPTMTVCAPSDDSSCRSTVQTLKHTSAHRCHNNSLLSGLKWTQACDICLFQQ